MNRNIILTFFIILCCSNLATSMDVQSKVADMDAQNKVTDVQSVMDGTLPLGGEDAYWVTHPDNADQKILLVPSAHILNWKYVNPDLMKLIKASDILVVESVGISKSLGWDDRTMIEHFFCPVPNLTEAGFVRNTSADQEGWYHKLSPDEKEFLQKNLGPILKDHMVEISQIDERYLRAVLSQAAILKSYNMGMDKRIYRDFELNDKTVLGLDKTHEDLAWETPFRCTVRALKGLLLDKSMPNIEQSITKFKVLDGVLPDTHNKEVFAEIAKLRNSKFKANPALSKRNLKWVNELEKYFRLYPDKSFVVLGGAEHFRGKYKDWGFLSLLLDKKYKISPWR